MDASLVSVVVPAFNAEGQIAATLRSALAQTYRAIEVIVVDDGSADDTARIASEFARLDSRVRVIRQENQGVAAARNRGLSAARGAYVAPLDADDLWDATKLEKQVRRMEELGPDYALVYSPFERIDETGAFVHRGQLYQANGWAFLQLLHINFVGNGSSPLIRRSAALEAGGYSARLREEGCQGCEDLMLQLAIAARHKIGCLPDYLVLYREASGNMSRNFLQMKRSLRSVFRRLEGVRNEEVQTFLRTAIYQADSDIFWLHAKQSRIGDALQTLRPHSMTDPAFVAAFLRQTQVHVARKLLGSTEKRLRPFARMRQGRRSDEPRPDGPPIEGWKRRCLSQAAQADDRLGPLARFIDPSVLQGDLKAEPAAAPERSFL